MKVLKKTIKQIDYILITLDLTLVANYNGYFGIQYCNNTVLIGTITNEYQYWVNICSTLEKYTSICTRSVRCDYYRTIGNKLA